MIPTEKPTATSTPLPTLQPSPYPTVSLSPDQALRLVSLILTPSECEAPCWNGLRPGISASSDVQPFFARLGIDVADEQPFVQPDGSLLLSGSLPASTSQGQATPTVGVTWADGLVLVVSISWDSELPDLASPRSLATSLGSPEQILLLVRGGEGIGYTAVFNYQSRGTAVIVSGRSTLPRSLDQPALVCLTDYEQPRAAVMLFAGDLPSLLYEGSKLSDWPSQVDMTTEELFARLASKSACVPLPNT